MRRIVWLVVLMMFAMTGVLWAAGHGVADHRGDRIVFRKFVCVDGPEVTLRDLADGIGPESSVYLKHFGDRPVADAPSRIGIRTVVNDTTIRRVLDHAAPVPGGCVVPFQIVVQRGGRVISDREIRSVVDKFLTAAVAPLGGETVIRDYRLPDHLFLSDDTSRIVVESLRNIAPGRVSFRINVVDHNRRIVRRIASSAFVDVWAAVPCAARPLNRGALLQPELLRFERKNLAYLRGNIWNGRGGPWRVVRPMGTGEVVYEKCIELLPDVVKGARVSLVYDGKTIRLEVPAVALEDGHIGSSIMVRNLQSNKQILCQVKDAETVVVH